MSKEVKKTRIIVWVVHIYLIRLKKQFDKTKDIPRRDLLTPKTRDKEVIFPFVTDFNPHLPDINNIISNYSHLIYSSPTLSEIFPQGPLSHLLEGPKNIKELLAGPKVLITQIMIHFPAAVSNGVASVINVKIILEEVKFFVAVLPSVFTILDNMLTVNLKT